MNTVVIYTPSERRHSQLLFHTLIVKIEAQRAEKHYSILHVGLYGVNTHVFYVCTFTFEYFSFT